MAVLIFIITCITMMLFVLFKPKIKIGRFYLSSYWVIALLGALSVMIVKHEDINVILSSLTSDSAVNPIKILTLFISMTFISVFLDGTGLFAYLAGRVLNKADKNQFKLFLYLYLTVSVLTVFTSNDIIILTFTPFICYFCKHAKVSPMPYLFAEFTAANTWSMFLIIGNPTNIYIASYFNTDFLTYIKEMALPTILAGTVSFAVLILLFRKQLSKPMDTAESVTHGIKSKFLLSVGVIHLAACTIILSVSSYTGLEMWYIALGFAISLCIFALIYSGVKKSAPITLIDSVERIPWQLIPFVLSMFILVLELDSCGAAKYIGSALASLGDAKIVYTFASAVSANILNNIPMSVLFGAVIDASGAGAASQYGAIIGSNIGALMTPVGALAGIMWTDILSTHGMKLSSLKFIKYGSTIAIPALAAASLGLYIF